MCDSCYFRYETPEEILARCKGTREKDLVNRRIALATDFAALLATTVRGREREMSDRALVRGQLFPPLKWSCVSMPLLIL